MANDKPPDNFPSSNGIESVTESCALCGNDPICQGLGVIRYEVPVDDPRFGKLFRCPNYHIDVDIERQERLRKLSNLSAFADKTFQNFEISLQLSESEQASLKMAYDVAWNFASNPDGWLLLEGTYGCGKTHLAAAVGNVRLKHGDIVLFITTPDLLDHLRSAYGPNSELGYDETFERLRNAPFLILDDLGVENPSAWAHEKLFQLLNHRYVNRAPTVITTNVELDRLDGRIRSRLLDVNLIRRVKITAPDYRSSVQNQRDLLVSSLENYSDMTFDTFDVTTELSREAHQHLKNVLNIAIEYAKRPTHWLILMGKHGCGKTHLAAAIAHQYDSGYRVNNSLFITVADLLDHLRVTFSPDSHIKFDQRFHAIRNCPLLILDHFGMESASPWAHEKLFQLLDYRYVTRLPTVITTARSLKELDDRILSRILDERRCQIVQIDVIAYSTRNPKIRAMLENN